MKKTLGKISALGLFLLGSLGLAGKADAQTRNFDGLVRGVSAANCTTSYTNPSNNKVTSTANLYLPLVDGWYHSKSTSGWINIGDTCDVSAYKDGKIHNVWTVVQGTVNNVLTMFLDKNRNYTLGVWNVTNTDTLVDGTCRVKHNGRYSDTIRDTFNVNYSFPDFSFNLATSDSVWNWTGGGNWNNILGDSVFVYGRGIAHGDTGSSRGVIRRTYNEGDVLPDIQLTSGVENEGSLVKKVVGDLRITPNPFTSFATLPGHEAERFSLYDISGRKVGTYRGDRVGEGLAPGVYFLRQEGKNAEPLRIVKIR
jgi:hypothetical protein